MAGTRSDDHSSQGALMKGITRGRLTALITTMVAVPTAVVAVSVWPSEAAVAPVDGGVYTLANGSSGKCLNVAAAGTGNGALLQQIACSSTSTSQQFRVVA